MCGRFLWDVIPGIMLSGKGSEKGSVCDGEVTGVAWGSVPLRISARIQIVTALPTPVSPGLLAAGGGTIQHSGPTAGWGKPSGGVAVHAFGGFRVRIVWSAGSAAATVSLLPGTVTGTG